MIPLTEGENKYYEKKKYCHICKKTFWYDKENKSKYDLYHKVRDHCHYTGKLRGSAAHNICNLRYKVQKEIPVVLHNGSAYDYHLTIKALAEEFKGNIDCLGENTENYLIFSVPLKKEIKDNKLVTCKLKLIDSSRFMNASLSSLVDNLSEINNKDCKKCMERNKTKSECCYINYKDNRLIYKCKRRNDKSYKLVYDLSRRFSNTYQFCNNGLNKFILLLRKGVYPYEYMDSRERFNETMLPSKESFYSELN